MYTLFYKMTHDGDPNPATQEWGVEDCMGHVRNRREYDAVIGVGGVSYGDKANKVVWVGIKPAHATNPYFIDPRGEIVTFDHFIYYGSKGISLEEGAPNLFSFLSQVGQGGFRSDFRDLEIREEITAILEHAKNEKHQPVQSTHVAKPLRGGCSCQETCE